MKMKKWFGGCLIVSLFMFLILRYGILRNPISESYLKIPLSINGTNPLEWINTGIAPAQNLESKAVVISSNTVVSNIFSRKNFSNEEQQSLLTWNQLDILIDHTQGLPNAAAAIKEAADAWNNLLGAIDDKRGGANQSYDGRANEKQCPHFLSQINATELNNHGYKLLVPCGLTQGSAITIIGTPNGLLGDFRVDLTGEPLPGEPDPPIVLHYNVRLLGDKITEDPVIVQNTWTLAHDWGEEERCPSPTPEKIRKVDELDQCNKIVGKNETRQLSKGNMNSNASRRSSPEEGQAKVRKYFPFKQGYPFVATLRVGLGGIQMTVDGKHITSFAFRESLEPWLVNEIRISGDLQLMSILASGLPTSEDTEHVIDIDTLKAPVPQRRPLDLVIGVFSTANNFKHRMAVRRTWMQYDAVRSGTTAVRFFVGLHKTQLVNEELWRESLTYGDIQLMPFVDYYGLITWKTLAISIFGSEVLPAKFIMKTDDDAFVRVDAILASLNKINASDGLLYGHINSDSQPVRDPEGKWYISRKEWPDGSYPTWANGPGYVISNDIAKGIYSKYRNRTLKMFKLEDVAMGIWIADLQKDGLKVRYEMEERICEGGCLDGFVVAHYQGPRELLCLWRKLEEGKGPKCCGNR